MVTIIQNHTGEKYVPPGISDFSNDCKVDLTLLGIDRHNLYFHCIPESVDFAPRSALKSITLLIIEIEIVCKVAHMYKSLDKQVTDFNEHSVLGHTANDGVELVPNMAFHELHLHYFHRCPFRLNGESLTV